MIIQYDTRPDATVDQKLQSLINSIMLAFSEIGANVTGNTSSAEQADIKTIEAMIRDLSGNISSLQVTVAGHTSDIASLDGRVTALENPPEP